MDFDLDLILPLKNREPGLSGKIVWYENLGDARFSSEKIILQINDPKFVIGFNFTNSDYPEKLYQNWVREFNYQDLLLEGSKDCFWQNLWMGRSRRMQIIFSQSSDNNVPISFLQITNLNGDKPDFIWADRESTSFVLGDSHDSSYMMSIVWPLKLREDYSMHSMALLEPMILPAFFILIRLPI